MLLCLFRFSEGDSVMVLLLFKSLQGNIVSELLLYKSGLHFPLGVNVKRI